MSCVAEPAMKPNRSALREAVIARSGGRCEWPRCPNAGSETAHAHSVGMGGRKSADDPSNAIWACRGHARMSDGERVAGLDYGQEMVRLLGPAYWDMPTANVGYERARALCEIAEASNMAGQEESD